MLMRYNVMLMKNKYDPVFTGGEIWQIFNKIFQIRDWEKQTIGYGVVDSKHSPEFLMKDSMFIESY